MNSNPIIELTPEQKKHYAMQPDMIPDYERSLEGDLETSKYLKGFSLRFWYNTQYINFSNHWHTALEIIMDRLVLQAKRLLIYTDLSNKEIAFRLKYNDPSYFTRMFKGKTNKSPSTFRKEMNEKYQF